jgi:hypothetical protein
LNLFVARQLLLVAGDIEGGRRNVWRAERLDGEPDVVFCWWGHLDQDERGNCMFAFPDSTVASAYRWS